MHTIAHLAFHLTLAETQKSREGEGIAKACQREKSDLAEEFHSCVKLRVK